MSFSEVKSPVGVIRRYDSPSVSTFPELSETRFWELEQC